MTFCFAAYSLFEQINHIIRESKMLYEKNQITKLTKKMTALEIPYTKLLLEQVTELCVECHHTDKHMREVPTDVVWNPISAGDSWGGLSAACG